MKLIINEQQFKQIILNEYINNNMVSLKDYLSQTEEEKKISLPEQYPEFIDDFLMEEDPFFEFERPKEEYYGANGEDVFGDELSGYSLVEWIYENNKELYQKYANYLYGRIISDTLDVPAEEYPAWVFFNDKPEIVKNQWLIHFTNDPDGIAKDGFIYGAEEMDKLGLTVHLSDFDKKYGGYNFAYLLNDFKRYGKAGRFSRGGEFKYGKEAVIFRASGLRVYHYGDEEPQVIFYGNTATNIIPIKEGENAKWAIYNNKTGRIIVENDDLEILTKWVQQNYPQYRKSLHEQHNVNNDFLNVDYILSRIEYTNDGQWYDVYPGYKNEIDNYEETLFNSKDDAVKHAQFIIDVFNSLPNPIPIYRTIRVKDVKDVDVEYPGESWSFSKNSALEFGSHAGNNVLLSTYVDYHNVNWEKTIDLFILFSGNMDSDDENEINVLDETELKNIKIEKYK